MALQTKTFTTGDFAWKSWSNAYVLELIVTEVSTDIAGNTSQIEYVLQLRSGANNRFSGYLGATVQLNGNQIASNGRIGCDAYYNHTYALLTGSTNVAHGADGTAIVTVKGEIWQAASNSYAPPSMEVSGSITLTQIPRVSSPTVSPSPVAVPGGTLTIRTNRKSDAFTHNLSYAFGGMTGQIASGVKDSYNWPVPEALASQIAEERTGYGTIFCDTYSGETLIGTDSENFAVTVPENNVTKPAVTVRLQPANDFPEPFAGMYIQGKSRLRATVEATGWYSDITERTMTVEGRQYSGEAVIDSDFLLMSGEQLAKCTVKDGRGYYRTVDQPFTVLAYTKPAVADVTCCRCDETGTPDTYGRRVLLKACRIWNKLGGNNLCALQYRIKAENGAWSEYTTVLDRKADTDYVDMVLPVDVDPKMSYQMELCAADDLGETGVQLRPIGTANTPLHLGRGGKNLGLGRHCDYSREYAINAGWDIYCDRSVSGVFIRTVNTRFAGSNTITVQTQWPQFEETDDPGKQSFLLFGTDNGAAVLGAISVSHGGMVTCYIPTGGNSVTAGDNGRILIHLQSDPEDYFTLISAEEFEILQD